MTGEQITLALTTAMRTPMVPTFEVTLRDGRTFSGFPCGRHDAGTSREVFVFMLGNGNTAAVNLSVIVDVAVE